MGYRLLVIAIFFYAPGLYASIENVSIDYKYAGKSKSVLVLGDSISAAYGIDKQAGWVALLQQRLMANCPGVIVHNASVSGETTAGGLKRLPALLKQYHPQLLIIELGGNDGLRGLLPAQMSANLKAMVESASTVGAQVVVLGMLMPPNLGAAYVRLFEQAMANIAEYESVIFLDFFLRGVAGDPTLMQDDGLHPAAKAQKALLANAWQVLEDPLEKFCQMRDETTRPDQTVTAQPIIIYTQVVY